MLYPVMTLSRMLIGLDGIWKFKPDNGVGFEEKWYEKELEDAVNMPVPASYNDLTEELNIREHYGWVFYQKSLTISRVLMECGQRIVLRFGAVTHKSRVYLNGKQIFEHVGGFLPFEMDVTEILQKGANLLTVAVDNRIDYGTLPVGREWKPGPQADERGLTAVKIEKKPRNIPNFDFFNYSGIIRPVVLYTTPKSFIEDVTITAQICGTTGELHYLVQTAGLESKKPIRIEVEDEDGRPVGTSVGQEGSVTLEKVHLWQPLHAYLYQVRVYYGEDEYILPYGVRTVEVKNCQFLINGQSFYFKGFGKHEDTWPGGRGFHEPMNCKDISLMKWIGANSFRTSHYPYSEEMMRLCDREGIVVIDETPAVGINLNFGGGANFRTGERLRTFDPLEEGGIRTQEHHRDVIRDMISRDKNYACVVMWSIANEPDTAGPGAFEYFEPLFELAKQEDPQKRPCTLVSAQIADLKAECTLRLCDVYCLNRYYGWYTAMGDLESAEELMRIEMEFWNGQDKPFMFTEYGADTISGLHDTVPSMFTEEYQLAYYQMNHEILDGLNHFVGEQVWNFADFATCEGLNRVQGNKKGIFTRDRRPKLAAHYLRDRWWKIPDFGYKKGCEKNAN